MNDLLRRGDAVSSGPPQPPRRLSPIRTRDKADTAHNPDELSAQLNPIFKNQRLLRITVTANRAEEVRHQTYQQMAHREAARRLALVRSLAMPVSNEQFAGIDVGGNGPFAG